MKRVGLVAEGEVTYLLRHLQDRSLVPPDGRQSIIPLVSLDARGSMLAVNDLRLLFLGSQERPM